MRKVQLDNYVEAWAFSSSKYVQAAVESVERYVEKSKRWKLLGRANTPIRTSYRPELGTTPQLNPE